MPFGENLLFLHSVMLASEPLLISVLKRPMPVRLHSYYARHREEERGHADWLAEDLASIGEKPRFDWRAAQLAGTQYYLVRHGPPEALLGYMACLECHPMPMETVERLEKQYGTAALRTLRYHAEHDIAHGQALQDEIKAAENQSIIAQNIEYTMGVLNSVFRSA